MFTSHRRLTRLLAVTVAAGVAVLSLASTASAAGPATVKTAAGTKPTIVLVHGGFADSSGWGAEVAALQALGYPVIAAPNPLRGLTGDADYVRSLLQTVSGPVVLVGHSYGSAVITNAARGLANVKALVYIAAFVPDAGENIATTPDPETYPGALLNQSTIVARPFPNPAVPGGTDADLTIRPDAFPAVFAADLPKPVTAVMAASQRPLSYTAFTEASGEPAWRTIPSWDLITLDDKAIPPAGQRFMAQRAKATTDEVHSSHAVMISHPDAVIRIILKAAATIR